MGAPPALQVPLAGNSLETDAGARTECNRDLWVHEMVGSHKRKEAYRAWAEKKKVKSTKKKKKKCQKIKKKKGGGEGYIK